MGHVVVGQGGSYGGWSGVGHMVVGQGGSYGGWSGGGVRVKERVRRN